MTACHARIIALVVIVAAFALRVRVHGQISIETIRARAEQADANVTITDSVRISAVHDRWASSHRNGEQLAKRNRSYGTQHAGNDAGTDHRANCGRSCC
jgi:hypothetical protein